MEFPTINLDDVKNLKKNVRLELCKPDKSTIGILKSAYNIQVSIKAMSINVLEFQMPLKIDHYGQLIDNPHIPDMRPYYLIRLTIGSNYEEYYRITKPRDEGGEENCKSYYCLSYIDILSDRQLISYSVTSYTINEVLNGKPSENMRGILTGTNWTVKYISPVFTSRYRSVESGSTTILNFILDNLVNAYNCLPIFDTRTNEISIYSPEEISKDLGLVFSYRKYIETLGLELDTTEFTTRLKVQGKDGLSVHDVTASGQPFLENFSYFMYGFRQDEEGNVVSSSPYWSDELCKAQIAYEKLLEEKEGEFETLLNNKKTLLTSRANKETEAFNLLTSLHQIQDRLVALFGSPNQYYRYDFVYNSSTIAKTTPLNDEYKYICMAMVGSASNLTVKLDGTTISMQPNVWKVLGKLSDKTSSKVELSGSATDVDVIIVVVKILDTEYGTAGNEAELIEKYCEPKKQDELDIKIAEIDEIDGQISAIDVDIEQLRVSLSLDVNFTEELIRERNNYIIEKTYENSSITDPSDLLDAAKEHFKNINSPSLVLELSSVNFLDVISEEAYFDRDKILNSSLSPGIYNWAKVNYEPHGVDVKCMIMEINLNVENSTLDFVLSNVREVLTEDEKALKNLYRASSAASTLLQDKYKWDGATDKATEIEEILRETWDAAARSLKGGTNNSVTFGRHGIEVVDPQNNLNVIRINDSYIGLSADGGNTFRTAISSSGVYAKELVGQIVAGEFLKIINESGTFEVNEDGVIIGANGLQIPGGIPDDQIQNAETWNNKTDQTDHDALKDAVDTNSDDLQQVKIYFTFSADGLNIGKTGSPLSINISNEQMDFIDTGQIVAYINGQKMFIDSLEVLTSLLVGAHVIEKYDDETTLVRWVG